MVISLYQPYSFCQLGQRSNQEDCRLPDTDSITEEQFFFAVCDGVGGSEYGEVASKSVCEGLHEALEDTDWSKPFSIDDFQGVLTAAYNKLDEAADETGNRDMASTLAFVCFHGAGCLLAHIGDSRVYQFRPGMGIVYRSSDHSQINNLIHAGVISPDKLETNPERSVISRYMEPSSDQTTRCMATVLQTTDIQADDYFFLCSDGVLECVDDDMLYHIICMQGNDEEKCRKIAKLSQRSKDNNTAYLLHVAGVDAEEQTKCQGEGAIAEGSYTEHQTMVCSCRRPLTVDVEADEPETSLTDDILGFIKKIFH